MKKVLIAIAVLAVIIIAAAFFITGNLDGYIRQIINSEGTAAVGTKVNVKEVHTDLSAGAATIKGFTVANPAGYKAKNAIEVDVLKADVDYVSQAIEKIVIDKPAIFAEVKNNGRSNFQDLLDGMPEGEESATSEESDEPVLHIKLLQINQAQTNLVNEKLGEFTFVMDDFEARNLSGTPSELSKALATKLSQHVSRQIGEFSKRELSKALEGKVKDTLNEKLGDKLKDLKLPFGKKED